jgi:signal transduction histidine kinase
VPLARHGLNRTLVAVLLKADPFPGPPRTARLVERIGLAAFGLLMAVGFATRITADPAATAVGTVIGLAAGTALFLARSRSTLLLASVAAAGVIVVGNGHANDVGWFALIVLGAWCAMLGGRSVGLIFWAAAMLVLASEWLWAQRDAGWAPWSVGLTVTVLFSLVIRHQFVLVERLRAAQSDLAQRSRAEERNRIARELHDIIAHSLTVSLLHVTSARLALQVDPSAAAGALEEAEALGRKSLVEVRATMGLLRPETLDGPALPAPGIDQVQELVDQLRRAGADISLSIEGPLHYVPSTIGSTVYRIVQEAVTNASKHAIGAPVCAAICASEREIIVRVDSAGTPGTGKGMGVENMAERARAVGGRCQAGPGGRGWLVEARLPLITEEAGPQS